MNAIGLSESELALGLQRLQERQQQTAILRYPAPGISLLVNGTPVGWIGRGMDGQLTLGFREPLDLAFASMEAVVAEAVRRLQQMQRSIDR